MAAIPEDTSHVLSPYVNGVELHIQRHVPPMPFGDNYDPEPRPPATIPQDLDDMIDRVTFALDNPPLETSPPQQGEEHTFTITGTRTLRRFGIDDGGAHVVVGYIDRVESAVYVAKIYDGVYYPLEEREPGWDCMLLADRDYATETWTYDTMKPIETVGGKLVPDCFGTWTFPLETHEPGRHRWVRMLLLQLIDGETMLDKMLKATIQDRVRESLLPPEESASSYSRTCSRPISPYGGMPRSCIRTKRR
jgi:hypothetical protein